MAREPVLVLPHDIAGQMGALASGLRAIDVDAWSLARRPSPNHLRFPVDQFLFDRPGRRHLFDVVREFECTLRSLRRYRVFHYFFGRSLLPGLLDARLARALRRTVVVHFRGSDVTTIDRRIEFSGATGGDTAVLRSSPAQMKLVDRWRSVAHQMLISTPDLWREVPDALLVPQAIDLASWEYSPRDPEPGSPVVIGHAPTNPRVKGTEYVVLAVEQLRERGLSVELELIQGIPPGDVRARMQRCHVAVDQVVQGAYGNVTIQFMALGVPTLNYLDPMYARRGIEVPTAPTTPDTLTDDLQALIDDRAKRRMYADAGRAFVETHHDYRSVARRAWAIYGACRSTSSSHCEAST